MTLTREELARGLRDAAYLEGDFVLRSGRRSKYYLDKYRFETRPDLLGPLGEALATAVREHEPEATRLAGPELGAVALAAAASLQSGLPFLIVRKAAKDYGTANRLEGVYEEGECVCLVEDVVTSGGAATALEGAPTLARLRQRAGDRLTVLAGGKITASNVAELVRVSGVREVHVRAALPLPSAMRFRRNIASLSRVAPPGEYERSVTRADEMARVVARLREVTTL